MATRPPSPGLVATVPLLACPVCQQRLKLTQRRLHCPAGHSFDIAKQGYINLLGRATPANADTAEMVAARNRFLSAGWYQPVTDAISEALDDATTVVEVGAGTGHYLGSYLDTRPEARGLATDISSAACRLAARRQDRLAAVVADTWHRLPVRDHIVDAVLCVFAPRNPAEFSRVLTRTGGVVVVTPAPQHLLSLRQQHGLMGLESDKLARLDSSFTDFTLTHRHMITHELALSQEAVTDLIGMGPNAFHTPAQAEATVTEAAFIVSCYRR